MALVVAGVDNDDAMVAPDTDGGAMTVYFTETPVTFRACRFMSADLKRREEEGQTSVVPSS